MKYGYTKKKKSAEKFSMLIMLTWDSYKTEGAAGSRILKLEFKNACLQKELETSTSSTLFCNYQIWFYENDKSIEFHIAANTVDRFAVNPLAVKDQEKIEFSMFPNPTADVLNLTFTETVNKLYSVYDLMGLEVLKGSLNNATDIQINVGTLQRGSYILRISGSTKKFIRN